MTHREFKELEAQHVAAGHAFIHRIHRQNAASRLVRETESLKRRCEEAGETETVAWLDSAVCAIRGALSEASQ